MLPCVDVRGSRPPVTLRLTTACVRVCVCVCAGLESGVVLDSGDGVSHAVCVCACGTHWDTHYTYLIRHIQA